MIENDKKTLYVRLSLAEKAEKDGTDLFLFCFVYVLLTFHFLYSKVVLVKKSKVKYTVQIEHVYLAQNTAEIINSQHWFCLWTLKL